MTNAVSGKISGPNKFAGLLHFVVSAPSRLREFPGQMCVGVLLDSGSNYAFIAVTETKGSNDRISGEFYMADGQMDRMGCWIQYRDGYEIIRSYYLKLNAFAKAAKDGTLPKRPSATRSDMSQSSGTNATYDIDDRNTVDPGL